MDEIATKFLDLGIQGAQLLLFGFIIWIMIRRDDALREADRIERAGMVSSFENSLMRLVSDFRDESKGRKIMETRLLVRRADKWDALTYVWNDEQTDAELNIVGDTKKVSFTNLQGEKLNIDYSYPNKNQCKNCHNLKNVQEPIGPKVRYLNKDYKYTDGSKNQLEKWTEVGYLTGYKKEENLSNKIASAFDPSSGTVEERAKSYLEVNCAHCHRREGSANTTGLFLLLSKKNPESWGTMKIPVAAGRASGNCLYDVVPGKQDASSLVYRMSENNTKI